MLQSSGFPATRWTLIVTAGKEDSKAADQALAELCSAYWYPLYAFVRRLGHSPDEAQDLTQEFFARFLERRYFSYADPAKGRFRSFLLTSLRRFLGDQADRENAEKRGGRQAGLPLDIDDAEKKYAREYADHDTPEKLFERQWALTLMSRVTANVRAGFEREGRAEYFERLKQFLPGQEGGMPYADVARELGTSEGALKVAVHRLRRRYRDTFHTEIGHLVADPTQIQGEVRHLLNVLRG